MQLFSSDDSQAAFIAVGMQPVGVIAIGIVPIGVIAIACGGARGIVAVSCGGAVGLAAVACGGAVGIVNAVVGFGVGIWTWGGWGPYVLGGDEEDDSAEPTRPGLLRWIGAGMVILVALGVFAPTAWYAARAANADHRVQVAWHGKVTHAEGTGLDIGAPCLLAGELRGDGTDLLAADLRVRCGHLDLYQSGPIKSGTTEVMGTDDLKCTVAQRQLDDGRYTYAARCHASQYRGSASNGTAQYPPRPSLDLDTRHQRAVLELDGPAGLYVELAVDPATAPIPSPPLFD